MVEDVPSTPRSITERQQSIYVRAKGVSQGLYHLNAASCFLFSLYAIIPIIDESNTLLLPVLVTNLIALGVSLYTYWYQQQIVQLAKEWETAHNISPQHIGPGLLQSPSPDPALSLDTPGNPFNLSWRKQDDPTWMSPVSRGDGKAARSFLEKRLAGEARRTEEATQRERGMSVQVLSAAGVPPTTPDGRAEATSSPLATENESADC